MPRAFYDIHDWASRRILSEQTLRLQILTSWLRNYLEMFRGKDVWFYPNPGNAGDSLIAVGTYQAMQRAGVRYHVGEPGSAVDGAVVFVGGGGNLTPLYKEARDLILCEALIERCARLVILPHTIRGNEDLLERMGSNVTIFCRDPESYLHVLAHAPTPFVYLDHDMALHVDMDHFNEHVKQYSDSPSLFDYVLSERNIEIEPGGTRYFIRDDVEHLESLTPPGGNIDISDLFSFGIMPENAHKAVWCFLEAIRRPALVITDRLHVAIGAALLGKPCKLFDNSYGKNKTVYRHSLQKVFSSELRLVEPEIDHVR